MTRFTLTNLPKANTQSAYRFLKAMLRSEPTSKQSDLVFAVIRFVMGLFLSINFGLLYKMPVQEWFVADLTEHMPYLLFPLFFAWAASLSEVVGGLLLALGLFTRPASFFIICTMIGAATFKLTVTGSYWEAMPSMVFLMIGIYHLMLGSGRYGLDAKLLGWMERKI
ncbi:MAG: DoxX family protein [Chloroflexota bacterium]